MQTATNGVTSEEKVLELLRSRNVEAVELLYDRYACMLFGVIHRVVKDTKRAEEILFKTFTHAWNHYNDYDGTQQSISIWMMSIARKFSLDSLSHQERVKAESELLNSLKRSGVKEKMMVLELIFFQGLSVAKIAEKLDCSATEVRTLLHQATDGLKNESSSK
ncbi:MAG TPA: sigma factor [Chitinophagales bacterium]|nr:sigma factor [Chitinophagales bacterium]